MFNVILGSLQYEQIVESDCKVLLTSTYPGITMLYQCFIVASSNFNHQLMDMESVKYL